jgi:hypothetical protein
MSIVVVVKVVASIVLLVLALNWMMFVGEKLSGRMSIIAAANLAIWPMLIMGATIVYLIVSIVHPFPS